MTRATLKLLALWVCFDYDAFNFIIFVFRDQLAHFARCKPHAALPLCGVSPQCSSSVFLHRCDGSRSAAVAGSRSLLQKLCTDKISCMFNAAEPKTGSLQQRRQQTAGPPSGSVT